MKTYWQAADANGKVYLYNTEKPKLNDVRGSYIVSYNYTADFLFPIQLKPLQIAEIKVNENGTWSYEIEREEGWYIVRSKKTAEITIWQYKLSKWHYRDGDDVTTNLRDVNISPTRIPNECII